MLVKIGLTHKDDSKSLLILLIIPIFLEFVDKNNGAAKKLFENRMGDFCYTEWQYLSQKHHRKKVGKTKKKSSSQRMLRPRELR